MRRQDLFISPLFYTAPPGTAALNAQLRSAILAEAAADPGMQKSNVGGWHSKQDLLTRPEPHYRALTQIILSGFREALAQLRPASKADAKLQVGGLAWAMVMHDGHYSAPHHHGEAHWAAVYYVDAGDPPGPDAPPNAGHLTFLDPRGHRQVDDALELFPAAQDVRPKTGVLVFFPGWLSHHVHPYRGTRPRISVSCNLMVTPG